MNALLSVFGGKHETRRRTRTATPDERLTLFRSSPRSCGTAVGRWCKRRREKPRGQEGGNFRGRVINLYLLLPGVNVRGIYFGDVCNFAPAYLSLSRLRATFYTLYLLSFIRLPSFYFSLLPFYFYFPYDGYFKFIFPFLPMRNNFDLVFLDDSR